MMCMRYDAKVKNKSKYIVFDLIDDIYVFDMSQKKMEVHNNCTQLLCTHVVQNYIYVQSPISCKLQRIDMNETWKVVDTDYYYTDFR